MRTPFIAASAALLLTSSSLAVLAAETTGKIQQINPAAWADAFPDGTVIALDDGNLYVLPADADMHSFDVGMTVKLVYGDETDANGAFTATSVEVIAPASAAAAPPMVAPGDEEGMIMGVIASIDADARLVILEDGSEYVLPSDVDLATLDVGMEVEVQYETVGNEKRVIMIAPPVND